MAKRVEFSCDGCDKTEYSGSERCYPIGWGSIDVSITGLSNPYVGISDANGGRSYDLCASCQQRLAFNHDPQAWPRAEGAR